MIYDKVDLLIQRIDRQMKRDGYCEMRTDFSALTLDVVSEYCLGQPLGLLEDETVAREWFTALRSLAKTIPWTKQFGWIIALSQKIPVPIMKATAPKLARVAGMHHVSTCTRCKLWQIWGFPVLLIRTYDHYRIWRLKLWRPSEKSKK